MRLRRLGGVRWAVVAAWAAAFAAPGSVEAAWSAPIRLSADDVGGADEQNPDFVRSPDGTLYAFWSGLFGTEWDIYVACSLDSGVSWASPPFRFNFTKDQFAPRADIRLNGSTIELYVGMWDIGSQGNDGDPGIIRATASTSTPCNVTIVDGVVYDFAGADLDMDMAADSVGNRYVVSQNDANGPTLPDLIYYFVAAGGTASSRAQILPTGTTSVYNPAIAAEGSNGSTSRVLITWDEDPDDSDGGKDVGFAWSTNGGVSFATLNMLDDGANVLENASVEFKASNQVYQTYQRTAGGVSDIFLRSGTFTGSTVTWGGSVQVNTVANATNPEIAAFMNNGNVLVSYEAGGDVYVAQSADGGATWTETLVSNAAGTQSNARVAVGSAYVVYQSDQLVSGDFEPFTSRDIGFITASPAEDLTARPADQGVEITWRLVTPDAVRAMRVLRQEPGRPDLSVGEALSPDPDPFAELRYGIVDDDPPRGAGWVLELDLAEGGTERVGPVYLDADESGPGRGCACDVLPGASRGIAWASGVLSLLTAAPLLLRRRRYSR